MTDFLLMLLLIAVVGPMAIKWLDDRADTKRLEQREMRDWLQRIAEERQRIARIEEERRQRESLEAQEAEHSK